MKGESVLCSVTAVSLTVAASGSRCAPDCHGVTIVSREGLCRTHRMVRRAQKEMVPEIPSAQIDPLDMHIPTSNPLDGWIKLLHFVRK